MKPPPILSDPERQVPSSAGDIEADVRGRNYLLNVTPIANAVRGAVFWVPTRELKLLRDRPAPIPKDLISRRRRRSMGRPPLGSATRPPR